MSLILPGMFAVRPLAAQQPAGPERQALFGARAMLERFGATHGGTVWPGFRPDTIPTAFVLPGRGVLLAGWRADTMPAGFTPLDAPRRVLWRDGTAVGAASTGTSLAGVPVAQVVVEGTDSVALFATAAHEAFHVHQNVARRPGRRFASQENLFYFASYPVFDAANEAGVALEGLLLRDALEARSEERARGFAARFLAARAGRHARLSPHHATFESIGELNEGLAEYVLVRALGWAGAVARVRGRIAAMDSLTGNTALSVRLRFYRTGPAMGLLLDRLAPGWQGRLESGDHLLTEALAAAAGGTPPIAITGGLVSRYDSTAIAARAREGVAQLTAQRRRAADSALAGEGMLFIVEGAWDPCGFDPQNMLRVDSVSTLHTRYLKVCRGTFVAELAQPVLERDGGRIVFRTRSVRETSFQMRPDAAAADGVEVGAAGVQVTAPGVSFRAESALVTVSRDSIRIRVRR